MKNKIIYDLKGKIKINVKGKNINRFIMRLHKNKIEILKCNYKTKEEIDIIIYEKDYETIEKIKTIYNIEKLNTYGIIKIKKKLNLNKYLIISIIIGLITLKTLTSVIFDIEIIYNEEETRKFIKEELKKYGIKEKTLKKNYHQIEKIKEDLINKYKDKIEWIEIETKGTKYIVRLEKRIIKEKETELQNRNIISKKDAIIKEIKAEHGQIIKEINTYVKKGDIIISGNITDNETIKNTLPAEGKVFGEVWYEINITYPFIYQETKELNNKKNIYVIKLLNKNIELFNKNKLKTRKIQEQNIITNNLLPISLVKQKQTETQEIEQILTIDEALKQAELKGIDKIKENLKDDEYIINYKILNTNIKERELELNIFFSVYENITEYEIIQEENSNNE